SIEDESLKYGIAVTGIIHPEKVIRNKGGQVGDSIILTKQIGSGIINTALKAGLASPETIAIVTTSMKQLNRKASEIMMKFNVTSASDVTGFGLLGHLVEMLDGSMGITIFHKAVPFFPDVEDFTRMGIVPAGTHENKKARESFIVTESEIQSSMLDMLFDAQTSGGLLFTVKKENAEKIIEEMKQAGFAYASIIGEVVPEPKGKIVLK
ncbi:MAG: selenide, water dikinase SelD, partial [Candidatus Cloacimonadota bacterium]